MSLTPLTTSPQIKRKSSTRRNESPIWTLNNCKHDGERIYCNVDNCAKDLGKKHYGTSNAEIHLANVHNIRIRDKEPKSNFEESDESNKEDEPNKL